VHHIRWATRDGPHSICGFVRSVVLWAEWVADGYRGVMTNSEFRLGLRFHLTQLGAERCRKFGAQTGTIVGLSIRSSNIVRVKIDGTKRVRSLHRTYIEIIPIKTLPEEARNENIVSGDLVGVTVRDCNSADKLFFDIEG
jgi:hypothetical protein